MKTYLHGPKDCAKKLQLRFRAGDLEFPEGRIRAMARGRNKKESNCTVRCACCSYRFVLLWLGVTRARDPLVSCGHGLSCCLKLSMLLRNGMIIYAAPIKSPNVFSQ